MDDFGIVREINPSEAADVLANFAVIFMVDYASDTPDELAIFVGKPIFPLTNLKSPVYLGRKGSLLGEKVAMSMEISCGT